MEGVAKRSPECKQNVIKREAGSRLHPNNNETQNVPDGRQPVAGRPQLQKAPRRRCRRHLKHSGVARGLQAIYGRAATPELDPVAKRRAKRSAEDFFCFFTAELVPVLVTRALSTTNGTHGTEKTAKKTLQAAPAVAYSRIR